METILAGAGHPSGNCSGWGWTPEWKLFWLGLDTRMETDLAGAGHPSGNWMVYHSVLKQVNHGKPW